MSLRIYIRGQGDPFGQFDETPTWTEYLAPVQQSWRYVQLSLGNPAPTGVLPIEGFAKNVTGGAGQSTIKTVTSEAASGAGSLDAILARPNYLANATIQWAPGINVGRVSASRDVFENVTIDGFANGHNGVSIEGGTILVRPRYTSDWVGGNVIIRGVNFRGNYFVPGHASVDNLQITGVSGGGTYTNIANVLVERCTFWAASDGAIDIAHCGSWISDVTVQNCLFYDCPLPMLLKYGPRYNLSIHHNMFTRCGERPQIKGVNAPIDWVNNVDFRNRTNVNYPTDWYFTDGEHGIPPYALRMWNSNTDEASANGEVAINIRNNLYLGDGSNVELLTDPGTSQANVYWDPFSTTQTGLGYNHKPVAAGVSTSVDQGGSWDWTTTSPRATPNDIPAENQITMHAVNELKTVLANVGCPYRIDEDQEVLDTTVAYMP